MVAPNTITDLRLLINITDYLHFHQTILCSVMVPSITDNCGCTYHNYWSLIIAPNISTDHWYLHQTQILWIHHLLFLLNDSYTDYDYWLMVVASITIINRWWLHWHHSLLCSSLVPPDHNDHSWLPQSSSVAAMIDGFPNHHWLHWSPLVGPIIIGCPNHRWLLQSLWLPQSPLTGPFTIGCPNHHL